MRFPLEWRKLHLEQIAEIANTTVQNRRRPMREGWLGRLLEMASLKMWYWNRLGSAAMEDAVSRWLVDALKAEEINVTAPRTPSEER